METLKLIVGNQSLLEALVNVVLIVVPVIVTWFVRNYVKSAQDEKNVALTVRLAGTIIGFLQDAESNNMLGDVLRSLNIAPNILQNASSGLKKLSAATKLLKAELDKRGIVITDEEAQRIIQGEFQKLTGRLEVKPDTFKQAEEMVHMLQALEQDGLIAVPTQVGDAAQFTNYVLNWMAQQSSQTPSVPAPETPPQPVPAIVPISPSTQTDTPPLPEPTPVSPEARLADLARQGVAYVEELKSIQSLGVSEADIAVAWVLTEVTKQGLNVNSDQIARAVRAAFG